MRCALYIRRSTEEHQAASIEVQLEEAKRYTAEKGWLLDPKHIFVDDAISRAEFKKRPGLIAMLNAAEAKEFDVVVARDDSRLGGDTYRTGIVIQSLLEAGAQLFYYYTNEEVTLDGAVQKFLVAARSFASELEREKTSQRTHEHLLTKARRGLNVGGRVYGYDNIEIKEGDRRVCVEYKINDAQAVVICEIFTRYARGEGLRAIVRDLNARRVPPPRAGTRGTGSWSISALWSMLRRERYRGILTWNKREKTYKGGTKVRVPRDKSEWTRFEAPHLRIIDDELWLAAHAQMRQLTKQRSPKRGGRPPRHLLSGFARCGQCGGPLSVTNGKSSYQSVKVYACSYSRDRGKTVCSNTLRRPVSAVNQAVIDWITSNVLSEELVLDVLKQLRHRLAERAKMTTSDVPELEKDAATLRAEIDRLVSALASSDQKPEAIVRAIADRQDRLSALDARLRASKAAPEAIQLELRRMEVEAKKRLGELQTMLTRNPEEARKVISTLFESPLTVTTIETADGKRFWIEGSAVIGPMLAADAGCLNMASPAGFEPA